MFKYISIVRVTDTNNEPLCSVHLVWGRARVLFATHLLGEDVVGNVHHSAVVVTQAFYFGHHRGLDAGVKRLVRFLVDEDPAAGRVG